MLHSRKLIAFLLALMLLLSLAACANEDDNKEENDSNLSDDATTPDDENTSDEDTTPDVDSSEDESNSDTTEEGNVSENNPDEEESNSNAAQSTVDLTEFFDSLSETYDLSSTSDLDDTLVESYLPGLKDISLVQSVLKAPMISAIVSEILLVECENSEDVATVEEIFQTRMQSQIDGGAWYPASIEVWEGAQIVTEGNYVALFAHENAEAMAEEFQALFA